MVTEDEIYYKTRLKYRLGVVLIWLGVLTWLPFVILHIVGEKPSPFWFLPFHLAGVVGGSRLRALARREMNVMPPRKSFLQLLGHGMILVGSMVWGPYFYLKAAGGRPVEVMDFLPYHLTGVLGGMALLAINFLRSQKDKYNR